MRLSASLLCLCVSLPAWGLSLAEVPLPHRHPGEELHALAPIQGQRLADHVLQVTAMAGETWSLTADTLPGVTFEPANGTGDTRVLMHFTLPIPSETFAGTIHLKDSADMDAATLPVSSRVWPKAGVLTRDDVKDRANWPSDPDFPERWDLFGFAPDAVSHPGRTFSLDAWERTPCENNDGRHENCTQEGQAGVATGMSADRAWGLSTGDRRVTVAVLDSGMDWGSRDVVEQVRLNVQELSSCLPDGATLDSPDVNHDGFFNIRDYAFTTVEDWNGNNLMDPQDLIHGTMRGVACSDGVDNDANGFVDDIAGWDFFWDDNDAGDDDDFGHGDFEARLSIGQAQNGSRGLGICPACSFVPLRVGDSFVVDVNRYAQAVVYAVDNNVRVVQQALGGLNNTPGMHEAVDYAYLSGVPVVAAASDLQSYHHNWPANATHAFMVHAIVFNAASSLGGSSVHWWNAATFLNFNNCTNYGAKLMLSSPGEGCSSEATAKTAGQAGLILSHHLQLRDANPNDAYLAKDLSAEEVYQLLIASADDIDVPGAESDPAALNAKKFPSNEGWDEHFGYGRNNAYRALKMLSDRTIPPEVDIASPGWFSFIHGTRGSGQTVEIRGRVQSLRTTGDVCFSLKWARGAEPQQSEFVELSNACLAPGLQAVKELGRLPLEALLPPEGGTGPRTKDDRSVVLELTATVTTPGGVAKAVTRRSFFVEVDPALKDGFPMDLGASGEASPHFADLDQNGSQELILATSDGFIHAIASNGRELDGFPVKLVAPMGTCGGSVFTHPESDGFKNGAVGASRGPAMVSSPAAARINGESTLSIAVATNHGSLWVVDAKGQVRPGFPVCMPPDALDPIRAPHMSTDYRHRAENGFLSSPMVVDLEKDGVEDIAIGGGDGRLHVWLPDGSMKPGFPVALHHPVILEEFAHRDRVVSSPTAADLDGDGKLEIVLGSNERFDDQNPSALYAVFADGSLHPGGAFPQDKDGNGELIWPVRVPMLTNAELLPTIGRGHPISVAAADIDGDGKDEVLTAGIGSWVVRYGLGGAVEPVMAFESSGYGAAANTTEPFTLTMLALPSIADVDGDGKLDVITGMLGAAIAGLASQGGERVAFQHVIGAWDVATGTLLDGFPAVVSDYQLLVNYPVADVDGDGKAEIIVPTAGYFIHAFRFDGTEPDGWPKLTGGFHMATPTLGDWDGDGQLEMVAITRDGLLFAYDLQGPVGSIQWSGFKHDARNSGNVKTSQDLAPVPPVQSCSCQKGCESSEPQSPLSLALWGVAVLVVRRASRRQR